MGTLSTWVRRGRLSGFSAQFGQKGRAASFSAAEVMGLALLRVLSEFKIEAPELDAIAPQVAEHWLRARPKLKELIVTQWPVDEGYSVSIGYNDEVMSSPLVRGIVTHILRLDIVFDHMAESLERIASNAGLGPKQRRVRIHEPRL